MDNVTPLHPLDEPTRAQIAAQLDEALREFSARQLHDHLRSRGYSFLQRLEKAQVQRAPDFHAGGIMDWSPAERGNELGGEFGELLSEVLALGVHVGAVQNDLKKLLRFDRRTGTKMPSPGSVHWIDADEATQAERAAIIARIRSELGDVFICASLVAIVLGVDTEDAIRDKFNATSDKIGSTVKL